MTELTKETEEEAKALRIWPTETKSHNFDLCGAKAETLIEIGTQFLGKEVYITCHDDEYSGYTLSVLETVRKTEEAVRKQINQQHERDKLVAKQNRLAKMSDEERLRLEIKELEKKLARKRKKLGE